MMRSQSRAHLLPRSRKGLQLAGLFLCCFLFLSWQTMSGYISEMKSQRAVSSAVTDPMIESEGFQEDMPYSAQSHRQVRTNSIELQAFEDQSATPKVPTNSIELQAFEDQSATPKVPTNSIELQAFEDQSATPSYAIFTSPKPFQGDSVNAQKNAVESWLSINNPPSSIVFMVASNEEKGLLAPFVSEWTSEFSSTQILVITVDSTFKGIPFFNAMFYTAMEAGVWLGVEVAVLVNTDIVFDSDTVVMSIARAHSRFSNYFLVAARFDVDSPSDRADSPNATLHTYGGVDLWAWNTHVNTDQEGTNNGNVLVKGRIPGFINGRGKYDNWILHEVIAAGAYQVIDASETMGIKHVSHSYGHVDSSKENSDSSSKWKSVSKWSSGKSSQFEQRLNVFLSHSYGTYKNQMGTTLHAKWKMARCDEPLLDNICLLKRERPNTCPCEHSPFVQATQTEITDMVCGNQRFLSAGMLSHEHRDDYNIPVFAQVSSSPPSYGLPFTLDQLLSTRTRTLSNLSTVVVLGANMGYFDLLLNKVCNLKKLGVDNYIIAAFDIETYRFAYSHGLPVFVGFSDTNSETQFSKDKPAKDYGTKEFNHLTKMKSRIVLNVVEKGVSALWSDLDMVWFENPLDHIQTIIDEADIFVQSNAPDDESPNSNRRINSGFYFVKAQPKTVAAVQEIVDHASHSNMSEQPSFYEVLCCAGEHIESGSNGRKGACAHGEIRCLYKPKAVKNIVATYFLSRLQFPNGATGDFWKSSNTISSVAKESGLIAIHNNWIVGHDAKVARQKQHGLWYINEVTETCTFEDGPELTQATHMINSTPDQSYDPLLNIEKKS